MTYFLKTNFGSLETNVAILRQLAWCAKLSDNMTWQQKISSELSRLPFSAFKRLRSFKQFVGALAS